MSARVSATPYFVQLPKIHSPQKVTKGVTHARARARRAWRAEQNKAPRSTAGCSVSSQVAMYGSCCVTVENAARKTEEHGRGQTQYEDPSDVPGRVHGRLSTQLGVLHLVERAVVDRHWALPCCRGC